MPSYTRNVFRFNSALIVQMLEGTQFVSISLGQTNFIAMYKKSMYLETRWQDPEMSFMCSNPPRHFRKQRTNLLNKSLRMILCPG